MESETILLTSRNKLQNQAMINRDILTKVAFALLAITWIIGLTCV